MYSCLFMISCYQSVYSIIIIIILITFVIIIPGHALHEKGLQRQKNVGPLVGSQEQRALLVPLITRG